MSKVYTFEPVGVDVWDRRENQPPRGTRVVLTQPAGCPPNGTMGHVFVADADTGHFYGLVLRASLQAPARKRARFETCDRHAWLQGENRRRRAEFFAEGGPAGQQGCSGGTCRLFPGTDLFEESVCHGELELDWTSPALYRPSDRLIDERVGRQA